MLQREEDGIAKPNPGNQSQYQQSVSRWRLVDVQNETRIKKLRKSILQKITQLLLLHQKSQDLASLVKC